MVTCCIAARRGNVIFLMSPVPKARAQNESTQIPRAVGTDVLPGLVEALRADVRALSGEVAIVRAELAELRAALLPPKEVPEGLTAAELRERQKMIRAMQQASTIEEAVAMTEIPRRTFFRKLKRYGIEKRFA